MLLHDKRYLFNFSQVFSFGYGLFTMTNFYSSGTSTAGTAMISKTKEELEQEQALMIETNEVEPTKFLDETASIKVNRFEHQQVDEDFKTTTSEPAHEMNNAQKFFQVICFWC